jgi:hypothetical protein
VRARAQIFMGIPQKGMKLKDEVAVRELRRAEPFRNASPHLILVSAPSRVLRVSSDILSLWKDWIQSLTSFCQSVPHLVVLCTIVPHSSFAMNAVVKVPYR